MKRLVLYPLAVAVAVVPATTGLLANASFSRDVPVRTPPSAQVLQDDDPRPSSRSAGEPGDDHGRDDRTPSPASATPTSVPSGHAELGDDHGGDRTRTSTGTRTDEPGDDHGGDRTRTSTSTSDDSGHDSGDDHGGAGHSGKHSGGHGSDD